MRTLIILILGLAGSACLFFPFDVLAATGVPDTGAIQEIENLFRNAANQWPPVIMKYTAWLFWTLVTISWTWTFGMMALKGTNTVEIIAELTRRTILVGIFWWLLLSAPYLGEKIVGSFSFIGNQLVGKPISATDIFDIGLSLGLSVLEGISWWKAGANLGYVLVAIFIVIILALIALQMLLIVVQYYVFLNAGVIMMGFLGHEWSREYAINYFRLLLALAVKFFVMQVIVVLTMTLLDTWVKSSDLTWVQVVVILPVLIVIYGLVKEIPAMAASMISGSDSTGGAVASAIEGAAMMGALAASGGRAAMAMGQGAGGVGSLAYNAWKQAQNQLGSSESSGGDGSSGGSEASESGHDPATAKLPSDSGSSSSEAGQGGGSEESDLSQLPRSHSNSVGSALDGGSSPSFSDIEQQLGAALQGDTANNTSDNNPVSMPQETPDQNAHEAHEPPKGHGLKAGLVMAATVAATNMKASLQHTASMTAHTGKTAGLAGKIAGKALASSGKQAFVNGFKACVTPNTNSFIGRANHGMKFSAPKKDKR